MAKSRNTLSHVYDEEEVLPIVRLIYSDYAPLLKKLDEDLKFELMFLTFLIPKSSNDISIYSNNKAPV